jgi:aryl-alcohol dehydrogenase-like predicted oxidoreductase
VQPLYNLYDREVLEGELESTCIAHGIGAIPFYALSSGFLSGKYRSPADASRRARGDAVVARYLNPRGLCMLAALDRVADDARAASPAQVAIAWQLATPADTAPTSSATSLAQLQQLGAAARIELDAEEAHLLEEASELG